MSPNREQLILRISQLVETASELRELLQRYERTMLDIAKRLESGESAIDASWNTPIPGQRRQVTEAIEAFEASRHKLRLALFTVGREEGSTISEVGRVLGISRQLASRLAAQAAEEER